MANAWDFINVWGTNCQDYPDFEGDPTYQTLTGLDHLEGQEVAILADGRVLPRQTVLNGQIDIDASYNVVHVGLPFNSDIETLNIDVPTQEGTLQGVKIKVGSVTFRFVDSRGGYVGPTFDELYEAFGNLTISQNQHQLEFFDVLTDENANRIFYTGDIRVPLGSEYRNGGRICYRQIDPLPVHIAAIIPEVSSGGSTG
jgi:hypothetical protein